MKKRSNKNTRTVNVSFQEKFLDYDIYLMSTLNDIMSELEHMQNSFDNVIDPELVDSFTYQILALKTKYCYYLNLCKERGLVGVMVQPDERVLEM